MTMSRPGAHSGRHNICCRWFCAAMLAVCTSLMVSGCAESDATQPADNDQRPDEDSQQTQSKPTAGGSDAVAPSRTQRLKETATRLWEARVAEDWSFIYEYQTFDPEEEISVEDFADWSARNEPFVIHSYTMENVEVQAERGWVTVEFSSSIRQFPDAPRKQTRREEKWAFVDDKWTLIPPAEHGLHPAPPHRRDLEQEKILLQRFEKSWQMRVDADWAALYAIADPRDHEKISEDEFAQAKDLAIYLERDVEWVQVIGDEGLVRVAITHKINDPNLTKLASNVVWKDERWVRLDDTWYLDLRPEGAN